MNAEKPTKMALTQFNVFILVLLIGLVQTFGYFRYYFSGVNELKQEVSVLRKSLRQKEVKAAVLEHQLVELQTHVAAIMPEAVENGQSLKDQYPVRNLASVVSHPRHQSLSESVDLSAEAFNKARLRFQRGQYEKAYEQLKDFVKTYPFSVHLLEAHLLMTEASFLMDDFEKTLKVVEVMMNQFPESELTGFAMLRLGQIFESQNRLRDASDVYKTVLRNFGTDDLKSQARQLLSEVRF